MKRIESEREESVVPGPLPRQRSNLTAGGTRRPVRPPLRSVRRSASASLNGMHQRRRRRIQW